MKAALLIALLISVPTTVRAETDANNLLALYEGSDPSGQKQIIDAVERVQNGIAWANVDLMTDKREPLYCLPPELDLRGNRLLQLLRQQVEWYPFLGDSPFGLAILMTLKRTFPCHTPR